MELFNTEPTPNCSCSAMHTDLECPTHGEMMKRCLERDEVWRIALAREHYDQRIETWGWQTEFITGTVKVVVGDT